MTYIEVILVTGSREWDDYVKILEVFSEFAEDYNINKKVLVIHGECRGVDKIADRVAKKLGFSISSNPAEWDKHGRAAGPIRNTKMIEELKTSSPAKK